MELKLIEAVEIHNGGFDIADDVFDSGVYFDCNIVPVKDEDAYEKVMRWIGENVEVVKFQTEGFTICKITDFIIKNRAVFDEFFNQVHIEEYQPRNFKELTDDDEEFYDIYITPFEGLIVGSYSDRDYELLLTIIEKYSK